MDGAIENACLQAIAVRLVDDARSRTIKPHGHLMSNELTGIVSNASKDSSLFLVATCRQLYDTGKEEKEINAICMYSIHLL